MKTLKSLLATAAVSLLATVPMTSSATLILTLDDLSTAGTDVTLVDGAVNDLLTQNGAVAYVGTSGTWMLNVTTGTGVGTTDIWGLDLNTLSISSKTGGTLRVSLTETNLVYADSGPMTLSSAIGGTTNGTVAYRAYADDNNAAFGTTTLLFSGLASGLAFADQGVNTISLHDPFSLTLTADIKHTGSSITSFDFTSQIPEPPSLALFTIALLGAGAATRRRQT